MSFLMRPRILPPKAEDIEHTRASCEHKASPSLYMYVHGNCKPHYALPARIVDFDYWPKEETEDGRPHMYGFDLYRVNADGIGVWCEFMDVTYTSNLPAIPVRVGYCPEHPMQMYPSAYWWVASRFMLWSIFKKYGLIIERV